MSRIRFSDKQLADMVMELVGEVEPVGETNADDRRFDNLLRLQNTVDALLDEIYWVCSYEDNYEYSMQRAGQQAVAWMEEKYIWLKGILEPKRELDICSQCQEFECEGCMYSRNIIEEK